MKVWITKYALTEGIQEREVEQSSHTSSMVRTVGQGYHSYHGEGREWHRLHRDAVTRAEQMRQAKIASHKKSIAKLEKLRFE